MAAAVSKAAFPAVFLAISLFISGVLGDFTCEQLDRSTCAFAVSSSGLRCVLEKHVLSRRKDEYSCRNSGFKATGVSGWIETDECVAACGLDRDTFGISSDSLLDRRFMRRLCSPDCYDGCFNVFDLYTNVAASEGVSLTNLCGKENNNRREMKEMHTFGLSFSVRDGSQVDARAPGSESGYYNVGRLASNRKLISMNGRHRVTAEEEEAAAPNPGHRNIVRFPENRRLISVHGWHSVTAEEEEASAPNPGHRNIVRFPENRRLISVHDRHSVTAEEEEAAAPNPGHRNLARFPENRRLISVHDRHSVTAEEEEAAAPNPGHRNLARFPENRRLISVHDDRHSLTAEEEAAAPA